MLGRRSTQRGLFEGDNLYLEFVGRKTFYGFLAAQRDELFKDEDFAGMYCPDNGRPSVPPSQLSVALLLQRYEDCSDLEAWLNGMIPLHCAAHPFSPVPPDRIDVEATRSRQPVNGTAVPSHESCAQSLAQIRNSGHFIIYANEVRRLLLGTNDRRAVPRADPQPDAFSHPTVSTKMTSV